MIVPLVLACFACRAGGSSRQLPVVIENLNCEGRSMTAVLAYDTIEATLDPNGRVAIAVRRMSDDGPLEGVLVAVTGGSTERVMTDDSGTAVLELPAGTHSISVSRIGYRGATIPVVTRRGTLDRLSIAMDTHAVCD